YSCDGRQSMAQYFPASPNSKAIECPESGTPGENQRQVRDEKEVIWIRDLNHADYGHEKSADCSCRGALQQYLTKTGGIKSLKDGSGKDACVGPGKLLWLWQRLVGCHVLTILIP